MELENTILSLANPDLDKYHMFPLICPSKLSIFKYKYIVWSNHRYKSKRDQGTGTPQREIEGHRCYGGRKWGKRRRGVNWEGRG